jgi:hypothetical protein
MLGWEEERGRRIFKKALSSIIEIINTTFAVDNNNGIGSSLQNSSKGVLKFDFL